MASGGSIILNFIPGRSQYICSTIRNGTDVCRDQQVERSYLVSQMRELFSIYMAFTNLRWISMECLCSSFIGKNGGINDEKYEEVHF